MLFARIVFGLAGLTGLAVLVPMFWGIEQVAPEGEAPFFPVFFYGFVGIAAVFQIVFLMIAYDVARYRFMMLPSVLEKISFAAPLGLLWMNDSLPAEMMPALVMDGSLAVLFAIAFLTSAGAQSSKS